MVRLSNVLLDLVCMMIVFGVISGLLNLMMVGMVVSVGLVILVGMNLSMVCGLLLFGFLGLLFLFVIMVMLVLFVSSMMVVMLFNF